MRRFERLLQKPVAVWEIVVEGSTITTREGVVGGELRTEVVTFASEAEAQQRSEALIAAWRAEGFIPITRVAPAVPEAPMRRDERREWDAAKSVRRFREISQRDEQVRVVNGSVVGGYDQRDDAPTVTKYPTIKEASAAYARFVREMETAAAVDERRAVVSAQRSKQNEIRQAERKEAQRLVRQIKSSHPELEAQCRASPDSPGPWSVYMDWLIERNDPIGHSAALAVGGDEAGARRMLADHFEELDDVGFELRFGFVRHVSVKTCSADDFGYDEESPPASMPDVTRRVLASQVCRFVDSLRFGLATLEGNMNDWAPTLTVVCDSPIAAQLRALRFDDFTRTDSEISWVECGDLRFAWAKLPMLELLHIRAGGTGDLGTLDLPRLRTFIRESGGLRRADVEAVLAIERPCLEHLELWTGTANYEGEITMDDLRPIFDARGLPALRHLGIINSELSDELIPVLATSRVLPQLHSLDLSNGVMHRTATNHLVEHAAAFRHLASIDLSGNVLYEDEIAEIRAVLDNVIANDQRPDDREDDFPEDPGERWVAVGE